MPSLFNRSNRIHKSQLIDLLASRPFSAARNTLSSLPPLGVVNSLWPCLYHSHPLVKWHAVELIGLFTAELAEQDFEAARIIVRRLMWNLNDESGGIGWGSPEAMGAILAAHEGLAREYAHILASYTRPDGNYLELEPLQQGLLWGLIRLARAWPELIKKQHFQLLPFLKSVDPVIRGLAAGLCGFLDPDPETRTQLALLAQDRSAIEIYEAHQMKTYQVRDLVWRVAA